MPTGETARQHLMHHGHIGVMPRLTNAWSEVHRWNTEFDPETGSAMDDEAARQTVGETTDNLERLEVYDPAVGWRAVFSRVNPRTETRTGGAPWRREP